METNQSDQTEFESTIGLQTFLLVLLSIVLGTLAAVVLLPTWMPNMAVSLVGSAPKGYWYLSRGSAFIAMSLLWLSMAFGLLITNKMARTWPGAPAAFALHEYVSLLGLAFAIFHALILLGDHYINFTLAQILVPFSAVGYRPFLTGLGQAGFYVWLIVALSFYVRKQITPRIWRIIHYVSFACYCVALYHGISSGTDTSMPWAQAYYWLSGASLLFLFIYRIIISTLAKPDKNNQRRQPVKESPPVVTQGRSMPFGSGTGKP